MIEEEKNMIPDGINDPKGINNPIEVEEAIKVHIKIVDELNDLDLWDNKEYESLGLGKGHLWNLHPRIFKEKENEWTLNMDMEVRVPFVRQDQAKKIDEFCEKYNLLYLIDLHYPILDRKPDFLENFSIEVRSKKWKNYNVEDSFLGKLFTLLKDNPPLINTSMSLRKTLEEREH